MGESEQQKIRDRYVLVCLECGSENVTVHCEPPSMWDSGAGTVLSFTCPDCDNDLVIYPY